MCIAKLMRLVTESSRTAARAWHQWLELSVAKISFVKAACFCLIVVEPHIKMNLKQGDGRKFLEHGVLKVILGHKYHISQIYESVITIH